MLTQDRKKNVQWGSSYCSKQRRRCLYPATRIILSSAKRGNRGGLLYGPKSRLPSPEEGWGPVSYSRSTQTELFPQQREIQDADAQEHSFPSTRGGLVCHCRHEGCLLPHSGCSEVQEVPHVCLRGKGLLIQGSLLRARSGPKGCWAMAAVASSRWMLHIGGGCGDPPYYVKRFEFLEKRYINVTNYYYY